MPLITGVSSVREYPPSLYGSWHRSQADPPKKAFSTSPSSNSVNIRVPEINKLMKRIFLAIFITLLALVLSNSAFANSVNLTLESVHQLLDDDVR
jgi:hypothetical protein